MRWFTQSELWVFKRCRRRWWLSYVLGQRRRRARPSPASLGTRVHRWLELYYGEGEGQAWAELDALSARERETWEAWRAGDEEAPDWLEWQKEAELARIMLSGYLEWVEETGADVGLQVVDVEREVRHELTPEIGLLGRLDLKVTDEASPVSGPLFIDHKTTQDFPRLERTLHLNEQVLHYQLLEMLDSGRAIEGAVINGLRKVKRTARANPPFYKRLTVHHSLEELRSYYVRLLGEIHRVLAAEGALLSGGDSRYHAPPTPDASCSWQCPFFAVCPMVDDPRMDLDGALAEGYERHDPLERYAELDRDDEGGEA